MCGLMNPFGLARSYSSRRQHLLDLVVVGLARESYADEMGIPRNAGPHDRKAEAMRRLRDRLNRRRPGFPAEPEPPHSRSVG